MIETATFPCAPGNLGSRAILGWIAKRYDSAPMTSALKHGVTAMRYRKDAEGMHLTLLVDNKVTLALVNRHIEGLATIVKEGFMECDVEIKSLHAQIFDVKQQDKDRELF